MAIVRRIASAKPSNSCPVYPPLLFKQNSDCRIASQTLLKAKNEMKIGSTVRRKAYLPRVCGNQNKWERAAEDTAQISDDVLLLKSAELIKSALSESHVSLLQVVQHSREIEWAGGGGRPLHPFGHHITQVVSLRDEQLCTCVFWWNNRAGQTGCVDFGDFWVKDGDTAASRCQQVLRLDIPPSFTFRYVECEIKGLEASGLCVSPLNSLSTLLNTIGLTLRDRRGLIAHLH